MRVVILAGGLGTRLAEETGVKPKPMVEIGGRPILWHIMRHYAHHGFREFFVALGYKGELIKRFFVDYQTMTRDLTVELGAGRVSVHPADAGDGGDGWPREGPEETNGPREGPEETNWLVHLVDTGHATNTGGRLRRLRRHLGDAPFLLTYGDGVCDVDLRAVVDFHARHGKTATVTAVRPPARFGGLVFDGELVRQFTEKPQIGEGWINGGFMVLGPAIFEHLHGDGCSLEADALEALATAGELAGYRHTGYWQCMDTLRELRLLESSWATGAAPWKVWG